MYEHWLYWINMFLLYIAGIWWLLEWTICPILWNLLCSIWHWMLIDCFKVRQICFGKNVFKIPSRQSNKCTSMSSSKQAMATSLFLIVHVFKFLANSSSFRTKCSPPICCRLGRLIRTYSHEVTGWTGVNFNATYWQFI